MSATALLLSPVTPPDYHRVISPTLTIPSDPKISIPVGLLACQRNPKFASICSSLIRLSSALFTGDPLLRELETHVVSCVVFQRPPEPTGKKTKKAVIAPAIPTDPLLEVILHDTVIFPEGGGQPTDTGILCTLNGVEWEVVQAKRHGSFAVHYVRVRDNKIDDALAALSAGTTVISRLSQRDFDRRYDHMTLHTSQHLLSALLETRLNLPTLSWSLTSFPAPCYVEVPRGMTQEEIMSIQDEANRLVFEGRRVHVEVEELDKGQQVSTQPPQGDRSAGRGLPEDYTGGVKRVVVIDGVDKNPCCGTHLPSLHNLQLFLLPHTDALSRSATTSARLYFLAGPRLIAHLTTTHTLLTNTSALLSCGASDVPDRVSLVVDERRKAEKRLGDVELELAKLVARDIVREISGCEEGIYKRHIHRIDDSGNVVGFLSAMSNAISDTAVGKYLIIFSSSPSTQSGTSVTTVAVVGSDEGKVKEAGDKLKSRLAVRGGGKGTRWSGKWVGVWKDAKEGALLETIKNEIQ